MKNYQGFFTTSSTANDYSFKRYLVYIKQNDNNSHNNVKSYLQQYKDDLNWTLNNKEISQKQRDCIQEASKLSKKIAETDALKTFNDINEQAAATNIKYYINSNNNNNNSGIIGDLSGSSISQKQSPPQEEEASSHQHLENESIESDTNEKQEDSFPSDLTVDHHPNRTADYYLDHHQFDEHQHQEPEQSLWIIGDYNISNGCHQLRKSTETLINTPGSLSDLRLLVLNNIFAFDKDKNNSVTKYFGDTVHDFIFNELMTMVPLAKNGIKSFQWCADISLNPPTDWKSCLSLTGKYLVEATNGDNLVDIYTAQVLVHILPNFISGSPTSSIEDSLVHHYIAPILQSIFTSDNRFNIQWANAQLHKKDKKIYKPDFVVLCNRDNFKIVLGEFKAPDQYSPVESDLVKIGKQMRQVYNDMAKSYVKQPIVCGILIQGFQLSTYILDLKSPKIYRLIKISQLNLFQNLDQIFILPMVLTRLLQLKDIAISVATKAESITIESLEDRHRIPEPPLSWLSNDSYNLSRKRKRSISE